MKSRRLLRAAGPALLLAVGGAYALASANWCGPWARSAPVMQSMGLSAGELRVGAARAELSPPFPIVVGGYAPPRPEVSEAKPALEARAVVLEIAPVRVAIVSVDLLLVPPRLVERIRAELVDLGLSELWVVATHAHTSLGAYDDRDVSELAGTGRFREDAFSAVTSAATKAVREAHASLAPARVRTATVEQPSLVHARSGAQADPRFTRLAFVGAGDGEAAAPVLAELWLLAAHPTLVPRAPSALSPDYPGIVDANEGPVVLVLQGAVGNASAAVPEGEGAATDRYATALRTAMDATALQDVEATTLGFSRVSVSVPRPDASRLVPWFTRAAGDNFLCRSADRTAEVGALRLGNEVFVTVPAEATFEAGAALESASGATRVLSLTNGYLGYVEPGETVKANGGEARRQYFGPELLLTLQEGAVLAVKAVRPGR